MPDIDIDVSDRDIVLGCMPHVAAVLTTAGGDRRRHPSGVYLQDIPAHPLDGMATFEYERAEEQGYFKFDLLNNSIYEGVRDEAHLQALLNQEPDWRLLEIREAVEGLAHLNGYFNVVRAVCPGSVEDLAVCIALIRPGKKHLMGRTRAEIDAEIWKPDEEGYSFKRSHATAYAMAILVQMNLLRENLEADEQVE